jgi:hypothetical protein
LREIPTPLAGDEDWGLLGQHGQNGVSLVGRSIVWWSKAAPDDARLDSVVTDLTWILQGATTAFKAVAAVSEQEQESEVGDDDGPAGTPSPAPGVKRKYPSPRPDSAQKRRR